MVLQFCHFMGSSLVCEVAYQKYSRPTYTCSKTFKEEHWQTLSNFGVFQGVIILADKFTIIVQGFLLLFIIN